MCGIAGFIDRSVREPLLVLQRMTNVIKHRGPDGEGQWCDQEAGIALGHRRLAIIDLSPAGHQPMISVSGRYVIVFNGEVYNHNEIRKVLDVQTAGSWRGHSDTEIMLAAFEKWGIDQAISKFVGMFAFAVWDRSEQQLTLARDRFGEKPLYYGTFGSIFLFGSELKAIQQHPAFREEIDRNALALYLRHNYIPAPYCIFHNVKKLPAGTYLTVGQGRSTDQPTPYWSTRQVAEDGLAHPFLGTDQDAVNELERLLLQSVEHQMMADVPLGAFLSGGIDSSTIVALMQKLSARPVKTFTIGFTENGYNEAIYAKEVARHLGTEHTELYVAPKDALAVIPKLPAIYDEPFSDSSQIPTFLISKLTREHVTVSLSGDAGDELFGGYNRYFLGRTIWSKIGWIPQRLRIILSRGIHSLSPKTWDQLYEICSRIVPSHMKQNVFGDRIHKLADVLGADEFAAMYYLLVSHWQNPEKNVIGSLEPLTPHTDRTHWLEPNDFTHQMMYLDTISYLPDDILVKVDRAAMAVSLETRVPFLDHRVVEFAWRLPLSMKIRNGQGKWILRQVLNKYVPKKLIDRPKMGFGVPIDSWLRGPLRDWAEALLDEKRMLEEGFFDPTPIRKVWMEHLSGRRNWQYHLWDVLMFQAWHEVMK
ncbi:MAG: asparagine synthase (glutamine-hydrolyzing) [Pseudomonadota bacterium]